MLKKGDKTMDKFDYYSMFADALLKTDSIADACKLYHDIRDALDSALEVYDNGLTCDTYKEGFEAGILRREL